ncbi:MAG: molybdenum ABC transporter ATP-binding protein [Hyphomicrobiales bacterium]
MSLSVCVRHKLGALNLDVSFESRGRLTALFGPSGSGKTSVVNAIAGLLRPDVGKVVIDGDTLTDTEGGIDVPVHRRRIGYVFQDARLFPHMTVEQNLAYGRWFSPRRDRYADRDQIVALLGIGALMKRRPQGLSGGEKQRVAIGRALLASPRLLLMDEPLASLDAPRKAEILPYIERLRDELRIPIVYVSHALPEVVRLASDVVVLSHGKSVDAGAAGEVLQRLDLLPAGDGEEGGTLIDMRISAYDEAFDMTTLAAPAGEARVTGRHGDVGGTVRILIRARDVMIATKVPKNISALNVFRGVVTGLTDVGRAVVTVSVDCSGTVIVSRITRQSAAALNLATGMPAYAIVKAVSVAATALAGEDERAGRLPSS